MGTTRMIGTKNIIARDIDPPPLCLSQVSVCRLILVLVGRECDNAVETARRHCDGKADLSSRPSIYFGCQNVSLVPHFASVEGWAGSVTRRQVLSGLNAVMPAAMRAVFGPRSFS